MRVPARDPPPTLPGRANRPCPITPTSALSSVIQYAYTTQACFTIPEAICILLRVQDAHIRPAESPPWRTFAMDPLTHADWKTAIFPRVLHFPTSTFPVLGKLDRHQITTSVVSVAMCSLNFPVMDSQGDLLPSKRGLRTIEQTRTQIS